MILDTSKPVDRTGNSFCGPLVVASILGTSTGQVADSVYSMRVARDPAARKVKRVSRRVAGTVCTELRALLERAGYSFDPIDVGARFRPRYFKATCVNAAGNRFAFGTSGPVLSVEPWHPWTILKRECRTLASFLRTLDDGTYIVNTPGHWAIASGGKWCETFTRGEWVDKRHAPKQNRHAVLAWRIEKVQS